MTAALEDQSEYITDRMPVFIVGVVGLSFLLLLVAFHSPLISLKAGGDEPALGRRRLRRDDAGREGRDGRRADRHRPRGADRAVHAGDDVRDPLRPLDGLRGLPDLADPRGVPQGRRHAPGGRRRPGQDRARDHRGGGDHGRRLPRLPGGAGRLPEAVRDRPRLGDLPRRHRRADGARARRDAAARRPQLVDPELAGADPAAAGRRARRRSAPRRDGPSRGRGAHSGASRCPTGTGWPRGDPAAGSSTGRRTTAAPARAGSGRRRAGTRRSARAL